MNKKAGKVISVYWFAILFIIAGAVVYMVSVFYGTPYDIREVEADILADDIADCLSQGGYLKESIFSEHGFGFNSLSDRCSLIMDTEDYMGWNEQGQYYLEVSVYSFNTNSEKGIGEKKAGISEGNSELRDYCDQEDKNLPVCFERDFYVLEKGEENVPYVIKILSVVRKTEKNV